MNLNVAETSKIDNIWNLLETPGYPEHVGPNNVYKSEMNSSHSCNDSFIAAIKNTDKSLGVKVDGLKKWTEKAAMSNTKLFTCGGTMKF
jgi:hypothetical protein